MGVTGGLRDTSADSPGSGSSSPTLSATATQDSIMGLSSKYCKERSLTDYSPKFYMAVLEGTLLTNGDLKGSWRLRRGDTVKNEFCMVLMDRGVYDGGFNIGIPRQDPSKPSIIEIHDKWYSFEWCESTKGCSNIWGRGRNFQFGECYLVGVHDLRQRRIVLHKVGQAEMLRAKAFARATPAMAVPPAVQATLSPAAPVTATAESAKQTTPKRTTAKPTTATVGQKRPRPFSGNRGANAAASAHVTDLLSKYNPNSGTNRGCSNGNGTSSAGGLPGESGEIVNRSSTASGKHVLPGFVGLGAAGEIRGSNIATAAAAAAVVTEPGVTVSTTGSAAPKKAYELTDFATLGACLKKEKLQITEHAGAIRITFEARKAEHERKINKDRVEEAKLVRTLQKLRKKIMGDEQEVEAATAHLKRAEADEQCALGVWNAKWERHVAPFIAMCEQDIKTKAQELQRKTREAETERLELEKALEQVHQVKKIGSFPPSDVRPIR